jgi:hypothetical protein
MAVPHCHHILLPELFPSSPPKKKNIKNTTFGRSFFLPQVLPLKIRTSTCWPGHIYHIKPTIRDTKPNMSGFLTVGPEEGRSFFRNVVL